MVVVNMAYLQVLVAQEKNMLSLVLHGSQQAQVPSLPLLPSNRSIEASASVSRCGRSSNQSILGDAQLIHVLVCLLPCCRF
jgi:hypothetical protein